MEVTIKVHGTRDIAKQMMLLPKRVDRQLLEKSLVVGAQITRDRARALAPMLRGLYAYNYDGRVVTINAKHRRAGTLQRAIRAGRVRPMEHTATVWVRVRPLTKSQLARFRAKGKMGRENPNDPFYWRFIEFGTSKMPAQPFMRSAFESTKHAAVDLIIRDSKKRVQTEIEKIGKAQRVLNLASNL